MKSILVTAAAELAATAVSVVLAERKNWPSERLMCQMRIASLCCRFHISLEQAIILIEQSESRGNSEDSAARLDEHIALPPDFRI